MDLATIFKKVIIYIIVVWLCPPKKSELLWWLMWQRISLQCGRPRFNPYLGNIPWRREWQPTSVFLPRKSHVQRSLTGHSPWGRKELDMTEHLHFCFPKKYVGILASVNVNIFRNSVFADVIELR